MKGSLITSGFFLVILFSELHCQGLQIANEQQQFVASPGESITLPCDVEGEGYSPWYNSIVWFKKTHGDLAEMTININALVQEPFSSTNRYNLELDTGSKQRISLSLSIDGVRLADNGTYVCMLKGENGVVLGQVQYNLIVPAEVEELTFVTNNSRVVQVENGTKTYFDFKKLQPAYVGCTSKGGNPLPSLRMYRGRVDVTSEFDHSILEVRTGVKGLEEIKYEVRLEKPDFMADTDFSGHNLKCISKVPKSGKGDKLQNHKQTRVATMEVRYAPEFDCSREWSAMLGDEQFAIECSVHANPQVNIDSIHWRVGDKDNGTKIDMGKSVDGVMANISVDRMTDKVKVSLTFDQVNTTHFNNYYLAAVNDLGERHFNAALHLATSTVSTSTTAKPANHKPSGNNVAPVKSDNIQSPNSAPLIHLSGSLIILIAIVMLSFSS